MIWGGVESETIRSPAAPARAAGAPPRGDRQGTAEQRDGRHGPRPRAAAGEASGQAPGAHVPLLVLLTLAHTVVDTYATTVPALLPFWQARFALSYGLSGLITGIANVTSSVAQPLVGILTDRGRDPRWIAAACLVAAAGISATGWARTYPLFLALVVAGGLGVSAFHPQGYKLIGQHAGRRQAAATSWFLVGGNLGVALGPLAGTALALRFGPEGTGWLLVPGLLLALALWCLVPGWVSGRRLRWRASPAGSLSLPRPLAGRPSPAAAGARSSLVGSSSATGLSDRADPPAGEAAVPAAVVGLSARRRLLAVAVLVLLVIVRSAVSSALNSFIPLFYVRVAGSGAGMASRVLSGMLFSGTLATLAGGYLADRLGRLPVLALSLLGVPPLLLLFLAAPPASLAAIGALWGAGAMVTASFSITVVLAQELWYERRALASGIIVGFAFGMGGLLVPLVGMAADRWGLPSALRLVSALPLLALAFAGVLWLLLSAASTRVRITKS